MEKISKSFLTIAMMSTILTGGVYASDAEGDMDPLARRKSELAAKDRRDRDSLETRRSDAEKAKAQLEADRKARAEKRAAEAEARRKAEEERVAAEAEEERLAAEAEASRQAEIERQILEEAERATQKAEKRAQKAKEAEDIAALRKEAVDLGRQLADAETRIGEANRRILELESSIEAMKLKDGQIAKNIIASNLAENKMLREQIAGNLGTTTEGLNRASSAVSAFKAKAAKKRPAAGEIERAE